MKIFTSRSSKDNYIVKEIVDVFNEYYIECWVDLKQIDAIDNIISKINEGIENCIRFLLVWSKNAQKPLWVQKERDAVTSSEHGRRIKKFSFKLDDAFLPPLDFSPNTHIKVNLQNVKEKIKAEQLLLLDYSEAL